MLIFQESLPQLFQEQDVKCQELGAELQKSEWLKHSEQKKWWEIRHVGFCKPLCHADFGKVFWFCSRCTESHSTVLSKGVSTADVAKSRTRLSDWTTNGGCTLLQGLSDQCLVNRLVSNYWEHCDWERPMNQGTMDQSGCDSWSSERLTCGSLSLRGGARYSPRRCSVTSQARSNYLTEWQRRGPPRNPHYRRSGALSLPMQTQEVPSESRRGVYLSVQVRPRPWAEYVSGCIRAFNRDPTFPTRPASHPRREQFHSLFPSPPSCRDRRGRAGPP